MLFERCVKSEFYWSVRREAALARSRARAIEKAPLFADELDEGLSSVDQQRGLVEQCFDMNQAATRQLIARQWRKGRALYFALPSDEREALNRMWRRNKWLPKKSEYFADLLVRWVHKGVRPTRAEVIRFGLDDLNYGYSLLRGCVAHSPILATGAPAVHQPGLF